MTPGAIPGQRRETAPQQKSAANDDDFDDMSIRDLDDTKIEVSTQAPCYHSCICIQTGLILCIFLTCAQVISDLASGTDAMRHKSRQA